MSVSGDSSNLGVWLRKECLNLLSRDDLVQNPNISRTVGNWNGVSGVKPSIELKASPLRVGPGYVEVPTIWTDSEAPANIVTGTPSCTGHEQASQGTKTQD